MQEFYLLLLVSDTPDSLEDCRLSCLLEDGEMSTAVDVTAARICCGGRLVVIKPSMVVSSTSPLSTSPSSSHVRSGKGRGEIS